MFSGTTGVIYFIMFKVVLLIVSFVFSEKVFSQASDFITVKKRNNRTIKTFFPGGPVSFVTYDKRYASGMIMAIRNDSIFIKEWDIRPMLNGLGIPVTDTLGSYLNGFHYKEIDKVDISSRGSKRMARLASAALIAGGTGYALLNVINGAYLHESVTSSKNLKSLGIAAGAVGTGVLLHYLLKQGNRYHLEYIRMNEIKKQLRGF